MYRKLFTCIQWTWGLPQTLVGCVLYLLNFKKKHFEYHGACVTLWNRNKSVSLGKYIFLSGDRCDDSFLLKHEYGHSIQSLFLGPLYLLVVGVPSTAWCNLPVFEKRRVKNKTSYYDFLPEKNANSLSARFIK